MIIIKSTQNQTYFLPISLGLILKGLPLKGEVLGFVLSNGNQLPLSLCLVLLSDHFPIFSSANSDSAIINLEYNIFFPTSMELILIITSLIYLIFFVLQG